MKYTKEHIDNLAHEVMELLEKDDMMIDVCVYWNGKRATYEYGYRNGKRLLFGWKIEDGYDPHDYFKWAAYQHILSMSFEGDLYYKYNDGDYEYPAMDALLKKYGLYSELGDSWNWSAFPIDDIEDYEYTEYVKEPDPVHIWWHSSENVPSDILKIRDWWAKKAEVYGDKGSCVIGAHMDFVYNGVKYEMAPPSPWQGSLSWEHCVNDVKLMLEIAGAEQIYFNYGVLD